MKKILTLCLLVAGLTQLSARPRIVYNKSGGGLFGYKYVTTTETPEENKIVVACADPGLTRCRSALKPVLPDGSSITPEMLENIDIAVTAQLTPEHTSGSLIYNNALYVRYSYNIDEDNLKVEVYTIDDAREEGLIP